jgi:uncharacterized repeat protein (TIGR03803 family)
MRIQLKHWIVVVCTAFIISSENVACAQTFSILRQLSGEDGANPYSGLTVSGEMLYGAITYGGTGDEGVIIALQTNGTGFASLYSFNPPAGVNSSFQPTNSDGAQPWATLICSNGILYGAASGGGAVGKGSIFAIATNGAGFTNLHIFNGTDGASPEAEMVLVGNTLYGTTLFGGDSGYGVIFAVNTDGTGFTNLHQFTGGRDGGYPQAGFVVSGNTLYSVASGGGAFGSGTVYALNTDGTGFTNLYDFTHVASPYYTNDDGAYPYGTLLLSGQRLYGTTGSGGDVNSGTIFAVNVDGSGFTRLHSFSAQNNYTNDDGAVPFAGLVLCGDRLYGTAQYGGSAGNGTLFSVKTNGSGFTTIHQFSAASGAAYTNSDGVTPFSRLTAANNSLYGTTYGGGISGDGTLFNVTVPAQNIPNPATNRVVGWGGVSLPYEPGSVFTHIGVGFDFRMAIRNDGKLFVWGDNWDQEANAPASATNLVAVAGGDPHILALRADGSVVTWGRYFGGFGGYYNIPDGLTNVIAISTRQDTDMALKSDGTVVAWGNNGYAGDVLTNVPTGLTNVVAISMGTDNAMALQQDGTVVSWGNNFGETNIPPGLTNIIGISAGDGFNLALRSDGTVLAWGINYNGQLDVPTDLTNVVAVAAGGVMSYALKSDGTVVEWGGWDGMAPPTNLTHVVSIAAGEEFATALLDDGTVVAWGDYSEAESIYYQGQTYADSVLDNVVAVGPGGFGSLALKADGTVAEWGVSGYNEPLPPDGLSNVVAVASGYGQYLALKNDGTITAWGSDDYHRTTGGSGLTNVVAIAAGGNASLALMADGTIAAWGQAGAPPEGLSNIVAIAAGSGSTIVGGADDFCLALRDDGRVFGWGNNAEGQATPPSLNNAVAIAAGAFFGLALKSDGTIVGWGSQASPPPPGLSNVVEIAAGWDFALALKNDGTVIGWGNNSYGPISIPTALHYVRAIAGGNVDYSLAIVGDGRPTLTPQPSSASAFIGETTTLSTLAVSGLPMSYQWQLNGTNISNATNNTLALANVSLADGGQYMCIVSNALGIVTNRVAFNVVTPPVLSFDSTASQLADDGFHLRLTGLSGRGQSIIYVSTNLTDWTGLITNEPAFAPLDMIDSDGLNDSARFYRASEAR